MSGHKKIYRAVSDAYQMPQRYALIKIKLTIIVPKHLADIKFMYLPEFSQTLHTFKESHDKVLYSNA